MPKALLTVSHLFKKKKKNTPKELGAIISSILQKQRLRNIK